MHIRLHIVWTLCNDHPMTEPLGTAQVAARLEVDRSTIVRWVQRGILVPAGRIGSTYYFDADEIETIAARFDREKAIVDYLAAKS